LVGDVEVLDLEFPREYFDCVICADVLEHTKDPWAVLRKLQFYLEKNGILIASIPNIRHLVPILKIVFDRFEYEQSGILDQTHLRFFTLHTIKKMMSETGFCVERIESNRSRSWKFLLMNAVSFGLLRRFSIYQFIVVARKKQEDL